MDVQDFLAVPIGASCYSEALDWICRVRAAAARLCALRGLPVLLADEGGLSPDSPDPRRRWISMMQAFEAAGLRAGQDVAIALDVASSSLVDASGGHHFARQGRAYSSEELIELEASWVERYPIVSIEDGLGEDDWENWRK